ncbi:MAG: LysR family transcriptional regulator [Alphaproteobacteria bacterium]|nr:LysR family transcriptional regulator [Alphaproteobacteria bacterium]
MLDLKTLEVFVWIARLGSYRAAAEKLNTTQPALTGRIQTLEARLGVTLFDRGARGATLTATGRTLLDYAERMLALRAEALRHVAADGAIQGIVRLGVSETIVHTWLPLLIERTHSTHPQVTLEIEVDTTPNLRAGLLEHRLDLAFLLGPLSDPRTVSQPLSSYPMAWVARPNLLPAGSTLDQTTLGSWPIITYPRNTRPYMAIRERLALAGEAPPRIYANASLSTIVRMALDGIGIAAIPPVLVAADLDAGRLVVLPSPITLPPMTFTATWTLTPDRHVAEAIATLAAGVAATAPFAAGSTDL